MQHSESKVPVFVFPHSISFILEEKSTHKQILTLYNPYDFAVKFKVLSTNPQKYVVGNAEGTIRSRYRVDIVVRHNEVTPKYCDAVDKFRIQLQDKNTKKIIGKQDIQAVLKSYPNGRNTPDKDNFQALPFTQLKNKGITHNELGEMIRSNPGGTAPNYVVLVIAAVCVCGLCLPTSEENSFFNLYISHSLKMIFSFVLGLVTMVILKP